MPTLLSCTWRANPDHRRCCRGWCLAFPGSTPQALFSCTHARAAKRAPLVSAPRQPAVPPPRRRSLGAGVGNSTHSTSPPPNNFASSHIPPHGASRGGGGRHTSVARRRRTTSLCCHSGQQHETRAGRLLRSVADIPWRHLGGGRVGGGDEAETTATDLVALSRLTPRRPWPEDARQRSRPARPRSRKSARSRTAPLVYLLQHPPFLCAPPPPPPPPTFTPGAGLRGSHHRDRDIIVRRWGRGRWRRQ